MDIEKTGHAGARADCPHPDLGPKTRFPTFASISLKSFDFQWYHPMISSFGKKRGATGLLRKNEKMESEKTGTRADFPHPDFGPKT